MRTLLSLIAMPFAIVAVGFGAMAAVIAGHFHFNLTLWK